MLQRILGIVLLLGNTAVEPTAVVPARGDPGEEGGSVAFAVIGDYGDGSSSEARVSKMVHGWNPEFIITTGDNNYPRGAAAVMDTNIGNYYYDYIAFDPNYTGRFKGKGSASNRFFPSLGNHDWGTP